MNACPTCHAPFAQPPDYYPEDQRRAFVKQGRHFTCQDPEECEYAYYLRQEEAFFELARTLVAKLEAWPSETITVDEAIALAREGSLHHYDEGWIAYGIAKGTFVGAAPLVPPREVTWIVSTHQLAHATITVASFLAFYRTLST